jgi:hypothetical protein
MKRAARTAARAPRIAAAHPARPLAVPPPAVVVPSERTAKRRYRRPGNAEAEVPNGR